MASSRQLSAPVPALHKASVYSLLAASKSKRGASVIASVLVLLVSYRTLGQLVVAAAALLLVPCSVHYTLRCKKHERSPDFVRQQKRRQRLADHLQQAPTRQQLIAAFAARAAVAGHHSVFKAALPPPAHDKRNKLTVVLDLDETLVVAFRQGASPAALQRPGCFELQCLPAAGPVAERIIVYQRPHLQEFLQRLATFADVVVFTAGLPSYAEPLVKALDPQGNLFSAALYRGATLGTSSRDYVKDLAVLGRDLRRAVLVDNNPFSFLLQPLNGIPVAPYNGDAADTALMDVLLPLLYGLAHLPDVRPVLGAKFGMPQWFQSRGYDVGSLVALVAESAKAQVPTAAAHADTAAAPGTPACQE